MTRHPRDTRPRKLTDEEIVADQRRAIISTLLRQRTWTSEDLARAMTVTQVAQALVPGAASVPAEHP